MKQLFFSIVLLLITTTGLFASGTDAKGGQQLPAEIKAISAYALQVVGNPASTGTDAPIGTLAIDAGTDNPSLYMKVGLSSNDWVKVPFLQLSNS
ncbi:MAG: hypothetical protein IPN94_21080, partial [Sphingobacteriales bacterium]|nr:hypothetical protein [Sphingobacteriales bacterium]